MKRLPVIGGLAAMAVLLAAPAFAQPDFAAAFAKLDRNKDGVISVGEITLGDRSIDRAMADAAKGASISPGEFEQFIRTYETRKFKLADANGDGVLVGAEIDSLARALDAAETGSGGLKTGPGGVVKWVKMRELVSTTCLGYDRNGDGHVTLDEEIEARLAGIVRDYAAR